MVINYTLDVAVFVFYVGSKPNQRILLPSRFKDRFDSGSKVWALQESC